MEKISQNTRQTSKTLKIEGIAYIKAFTTIWNKARLIQVLDPGTPFIIDTFIPCHLEIALRGRKALNVLKDLRAVKFALPSIARLKMDT